MKGKDYSKVTQVSSQVDWVEMVLSAQLGNQRIDRMSKEKINSSFSHTDGEKSIEHRGRAIGDY